MTNVSITQSIWSKYKPNEKWTSKFNPCNHDLIGIMINNCQLIIIFFKNEITTGKHPYEFGVKCPSETGFCKTSR